MKIAHASWSGWYLRLSQSQFDHVKRLLNEAGFLFDDIGVELFLVGGFQRAGEPLQDGLVLGAECLETLGHRFGAAHDLLLSHCGRLAYGLQLAPESKHITMLLHCQM